MEKELKNQLPQWNNGWGVRHSQIFLFFFCNSAVYTIRLNITLAVVAMTTSTTMNIPMSPTEKGLALSSMYWGYGLLQTFLGNLGRKTNSVRVLSFCLLISAILSLATPLAGIYYGSVGIIVVRVLIGIVQGGVYPSLNNLLAMWAVPQEKDVLVPFVYNGISFGIFVTMFASGFLAKQFDWPSIFYSTGILGIVVGGALLYFGKCSPSEHKGLSKEEREFMKNSLGDIRLETMRNLSVPWTRILTSGPMIALTITHCCNNWSYGTMSAVMPSFLNGGLHFDVQSDGFLSSLSPLASLLFSFLFTIISVKIRNLMPPMYAKYMWNSIGMYGCGLALILLAYTRDATIAIVLITAGNGVAIGCNMGFQTNHIDLSPNFAGILYSFTNSIGNFASIFGPIVSSYLVGDISNLDEWRIVFLLTAAVLVFGNTCFLCWGTTETQKWNEGEVKEEQVVI